jgi:hypothetical protein
VRCNVAAAGGASAWPVRGQGNHPRERQREPRELYANGTAVRLLAQEKTFIGCTHEAPDDHAHGRDEPRRVLESRSLQGNEHEPQETVLGTLNERHRDALAHLSDVVNTKPLVGKMAAAIHHELGAKNPADGPARDERGHQRVRESRQLGIGPPTMLQDQPDDEGQGDTAEARETALPDSNPTTGVVVVVTPVRGDIGHARADEAANQQPYGELAEWLNVEACSTESAPGVEVRHVRGDGQAEAVGVKDEWTEVKSGRKTRHLGPRASESHEATVETDGGDVHNLSRLRCLNHQSVT